jgi:hypothetical protein
MHRESEKIMPYHAGVMAMRRESDLNMVRTLRSCHIMREQTGQAQEEQKRGHLRKDNLGRSCHAVMRSNE